MNKVILIDDDISFKDTFQIEAQNRSIGVFHKTSFDGLRQLMPAYRNSVVAVVLDIKCMISENQAKEDTGFIGTALKYLDSTSPGFPRIILTGDDSAFESLKSFNPDELIFQKTPQGIKDAFSQLEVYSSDSEILRIKRLHADVFSLFEKGFYSNTAESTLINVLREIDTTDFSKFGGILRDVRALQETIFKTITSKNSNVVPVSMFKSNGMLKFNELMKHLNGNPSAPNFSATSTVYQNAAIYNISNSLYWTCGKYIHADPTETYFISNYSLRAMIYSLLEIFKWSEPYIK